MLEIHGIIRRSSALPSEPRTNHNDARIRALPAATRLSLRAKGIKTVEREKNFGLTLELPINHCVGSDDCRFARLGPDEWLLIGREDDVEQLVREVEPTLAGRFYTYVDISHRQVGIEVSGPAAVDVLNVGCPLDLHPSSFPVGSATRTVLGKTEIVLMRPTAETTFHIEVWRSLSAYALNFLLEAVSSCET